MFHTAQSHTVCDDPYNSVSKSFRSCRQGVGGVAEPSHTADSDGHGRRGRYYCSADCEGLADVIRVEKQLDFEETTDPWENLPLRYNATSPWSARFTCYLKLHCGGAPKAIYTFRLESRTSPRNPPDEIAMGGGTLSS